MCNFKRKATGTITSSLARLSIVNRKTHVLIKENLQIPLINYEQGCPPSSDRVNYIIKLNPAKIPLSHRFFWKPREL